MPAGQFLEGMSLDASNCVRIIVQSTNGSSVTEADPDARRRNGRLAPHC